MSYLQTCFDVLWIINVFRLNNSSKGREKESTSSINTKKGALAYSKLCRSLLRSVACLLFTASGSSHSPSTQLEEVWVVWPLVPQGRRRSNGDACFVKLRASLVSIADIKEPTLANLQCSSFRYLWDPALWMQIHEQWRGFDCCFYR